jgi:hypothetical protein
MINLERSTRLPQRGAREGEATVRGISRKGGAVGVGPATRMPETSISTGKSRNRTAATVAVRPKKDERPRASRKADQVGSCNSE